MSNKFLIETHGVVSLIRFNDPATRNALTMEMGDELRALLWQEQTRSRVIVLAGSPVAFCSGANLSGDGIALGELDAGEGLEMHINPLILALQTLGVPLITAVRGAAAGVGASLGLLGDLVVAGKSAYFLQAFCKIGLIPDGGAPWLLANTAGRVRAMEMMMLGEKLPASKAYEWGMINRLVEDDQVEPEALALAQRLAAGPRLALALTRRVAWAAAESSFAEELALERRLQREAGLHPDFAEGVTAFLSKRPARFA